MRTHDSGSLAVAVEGVWCRRLLVTVGASPTYSGAEYRLQLILPDSLVGIDRRAVRPPLQLLHGDRVRDRGLRHLNFQASRRPDAIDPGVSPSAESRC
jgi:hypothetical protein